MAAISSVDLFFQQATDANGSAVKITDGGHFDLAIWGTFGGGSVRLEESRDNSTFWTIPDTTYTANGATIVEISNGAFIRAVLADSVGASINVELNPV